MKNVDSDKIGLKWVPFQYETALKKLKWLAWDAKRRGISEQLRAW